MSVRLRVARLCAAIALVFGFAATSQAGTITLTWDAPPFADIAGYVIFYGTTPGAYPYALGVGNQTTADVHGLAGGQTYYFVVRAYSSLDVLGPPSNESSDSTTNTTPLFPQPAPVSSNEGSAVSLQIQASDPDGDPLSYTATGLPAGLFINPTTGIIGGTPSYTSAGVYQVAITVSDGFLAGTLTESRTLTWTVLDVNGPPVVALIPNQTSSENQTIGLLVTASDPDGDVSTFTAAGLPPGLSISSAGLISGTLSFTSSGVYPVTVIATAGGLTGRQGFTWTVSNVDRPPTVTSIPNQTFGQYATVLVPVTANDLDGDSLTLSATGLPPGLTITQTTPTGGRISGTLSPASVGVYAVTVTATAQGLTGTQHFTWTVTSQTTFPLKASTNGRYLIDQNNAPFLMTGDSPQSIIANLSVADATTYLTDRKTRGINAVWINLVCKTPQYACKANGATFDSLKPFTAGATDFEDLTTPNPDYFARADAIINLAVAQNMLVILDPIDTGGWMQTLRNSSLANARAYGQFVGNRYKNVGNIIWMSGNDFQTWRTPSDDAVVREVALGIRDVDAQHIHTVELDWPVSNSLDDTTWAPIIGLEASYTYGPPYAEVLNAYNRPGFLPVFMVESNYEDENLHFDTGDPETLRRQEYWTALSGATGQLYGNKYTWQFLTGWPSHLSTPGTLQFGYLRSLFEPREWFNLIPDQTHTIVTSGYGTFSSSTTVSFKTNDYVTAASTPDGSLVMAYLPTVRTVTVDMSRLSGPSVARWFDPTAGTLAAIAGSPFPNSGIASFTPPAGNHPDGSGDWVLVLESSPGIVITNPGNRTSPQGAAVSLQVVASDPYGDTLTYSATNLPDGLAINGSSGLIFGSIGLPSGLPTFNVTVTASDGTLTASQSFTWTVIVNTTPPVLDNPGNQTGGAGSTVSVQLHATDTDGATIVYKATGLPPGLTVSQAGLISGTLSGTTAIYGVTATASDGVLSSSQPFTWTVLLGSSFVQASSAAPQTSQTSVTIPFTGAQTAGNLNVVVVGWADSTAHVQSVTDTKGNSYSLAVGPTVRTGAPGDLTQSIYYAKSISAAAANGNSVVVAFNVAAQFPDIRIAEYRGIDKVALPDGAVGAIGNSTTSSSGPLVTTNANDLLVGANTVTTKTTGPGAGFTSRVITFPDGNILMDRVVTATGSYSATAPLDPLNSGGWIMQLVAFRAAGGALNQPPTLNVVADRTDAENTAVSVQLVGADPDGNSITYSATNLPNGLTINATTGLISGTLTYFSAGVYSVTATVSDQSLTTSRNFTWTVTNVNRTPTIAAIADRTSAETDSVTLAVSASDLDTDDVLSYSATGLPTDLTINATTGVISGTLSYTSAGSHAITVTVNDGRGAANSTATTPPFIWTVTNTNRAPIPATIQNRTDFENDSVTLDAHATDPDSDDVLHYSATGLPQGVTIGDLTGVISGTLSYTSAGPHTVTVTVNDGRGAANSTATSPPFSWTVTNTNRAPVVNTIANQTSAENDTISLTTGATDADGDPLTYSATGLPQGLTINPSSGVISGTLSYTSFGSYAVSVIVNDGRGALNSTASSPPFNWTVTNTNRAPVVNTIANQTSAENDTISLATGATDADGDPLTYSATGLPQGLTINPSSGVISGTLSYTSFGSYAVSVIVNDGRGALNSTAGSPPFNWTVTNTNRAPVVNTIANQTSAENDTISLGTGAVDPDGDTVTFSGMGLPSGLSINTTSGMITGTLSYTSAGPYVVVVSASDGTLTGSQTFSWTVGNMNRPPTLAPIGSLSTTVGATIALPVVGTDPDGDTLTFGVSGLPAGVSIDAISGLVTGAPSTAGVYNVTISAIDSSLSGTAAFEWTVVPPDSDARVTFMQAHSSSVLSGAAALTVPYPAAQLASSLSVAVVGWNDPAAQVLSVVDTAGNTYHLAVGPTTRDGLGSQSIYYAANVLAAAPGVNHVTVTFTSPASLAEARIIEYQGIEPANARDVFAGAAGNSGEAASGSATTTFRNDLLFGATWVSAATTAPEAGLIARLTTASGTLLEDRTVHAVGSYSVNASVSPASPWIIQMVAFRDVNHAPDLSNPGDQMNPPNATISLPLLAHDSDNDVLIFGATGLPPGLSVNSANGVISGVLTLASVGTFSVTATAFDGFITTPTTFQWTVAVPTIGANAASLIAGSAMTFSWAAITAPTATDWVALVPAGAVDTAYVAFWFTTGTSSGNRVVTLPTALASGTYELRLFAHNSLQQLAVSSALTVTGLALSASPGSLGAAGTVIATWSGIGGATSTDWIGVIPTGAPDTAYVAWDYTTGTSSGSKSLALPPSAGPGTYELRLFANNTSHRLAVSNTFTVSTATLTASPATVLPGGTVTATWAGLGTPNTTDWIGLVPTGSPDTAYVVWGYMTGASTGSKDLTLPSAMASGTYELRLFFKDSVKRLAVSNTITVPAATLTASPATVAPGGTLTVSWQGMGTPSASDWLALVPLGASDQSYVAWVFSTGRSSDSTLFVLPATLPAGSYDVRLFANNTFKRLATSDGVTVTAPGPTLTASPVATAPGGTLTVAWRNIAAPTATDWVGVYAAGTADASYLTRFYTNGRASDRTLFLLPTDLVPGSYELRLFANDTMTRLATANAFSVATGPSLTGSPVAVAAGGTLSINWAGIAVPTATDWVGLMPLNASDASYVAWSHTTGAASGSLGLAIPESVPAGTYELRLFTQDTVQRLAVGNLVTVGPTLIMSPTSVAPGGTVTVTWAGISTPTVTDWLAVVPINAPDTSYVGWAYTNGLAGDSTTFVLPAALPAGRYDLRLFAHDSRVRLALSNVVTVTAPGPTLAVSPVKAVAGLTLTAAWQGIVVPTPSDWIGLYAVGTDDATFLTKVFTSGVTTGSTSLTLPGVLAPGPYELRLFANNTFTPLAVSNGVFVNP